MTITYHTDLIQGSQEWLDIRCGVLTASEMKCIITPSTLAYSINEKSKSHLYEMISQRITKYVEPHFISEDMLRGYEDEIEARRLYSLHASLVKEVGFITNDRWGFTLGYSPDGLVNDSGLIEIKSRRGKYQIETILNDKVPTDYMLQLQTGLLVSERKWIDFISYSGGLALYINRVLPDQKIQDAIVEAATKFHADVDKGIHDYIMQTTEMIKTERRIEMEIIV